MRHRLSSTAKTSLNQSLFQPWLQVAPLAIANACPNSIVWLLCKIVRVGSSLKFDICSAHQSLLLRRYHWCLSWMRKHLSVMEGHSRDTIVIWIAWLLTSQYPILFMGMSSGLLRSNQFFVITTIGKNSKVSLQVVFMRRLDHCMSFNAILMQKKLSSKAIVNCQSSHMSFSASTL